MQFGGTVPTQGPTGAHKGILGKPLDDFLSDNGWARGDLDTALDTHVRYLTPDQVDMLAQVRDRITVDGDTWMQKVVDDDTALNLLYNERGSRTSPDQIYGFTARAGDVVEMRTPRQIFERLALNYEATTFSRVDSEVTVVRYQTDNADAHRIPRHSALFGDSGHQSQASWDENAWQVTPARGDDAQALADRGTPDPNNPGEITVPHLVMQPGILLADEPTAQLDSETGAQIMDLIARLVHERGTAAVVATHDPAMLARADRVLELHDGELRRRSPRRDARRAAQQSSHASRVDGHGEESAAERSRA